jgi:hypothetical protein
MHQRAPTSVATAIRTFVLGMVTLSIGSKSATAQMPELARGTPVIEGRIQADPSEGLLDGATCLRGFTPSREVRFLLNHALNVRSVTTEAGVVLDYGGETRPVNVDDGREYIVALPDTVPPLAAFCVEYRGAVPVYDSNTATVDWKGRIAAGFGTLRAAEQSHWYPTLYESSTGRKTTDVGYSLDISCPTCEAIYLNGSAPVRGTSARFESTTPRPLLLYAGSFDFRETDHVTFIGGAASDSAATVFSRLVRQIGEFYSERLGRSYEERPVLLSFNSISRLYPPGQVSWQFVSWPTITFSGGLDFDAFVDPSSQLGVSPALARSLSHEMAHHYFGTLHVPHGPLFWFALESTAEYLSLLATRELQGELALLEYLAQFPRDIGDEEFPALTEVREPRELSATHYYRLAPAQLLMLEAEVGSASVLALLRALLDAGEEPIDFPFLQRAAAGVNISEATLQKSMGASPREVREFIGTRAHRALATAVLADSVQPTLRLAASLADSDTTRAGRLQVMRSLATLAERFPDDGSVPYAIGRLGALTGLELELAAASLESYLSRPAPPGSPSHAAANWRLGMVKEHAGDTNMARTLFERALEQDPELRGAREALQRLRRPDGP